MVLYALPELDGAVDSVVLGGLVGDKIALVPERLRRLTGRVKRWIQLRKTPASDRRVAVVLYGFPPNVGAVGTAALLNVPKSLEALLKDLHQRGYDLGPDIDPDDLEGVGEDIVATLKHLQQETVVAGGASKLAQSLGKAAAGAATTAGGAKTGKAGLARESVRGVGVSRKALKQNIGKRMGGFMERCWGPLNDYNGGLGLSQSQDGNLLVAGIELGNVWIGVQPLLGVEGDPMRLLFEKDLTPHPQYAAFYRWLASPRAAPASHPDHSVSATSPTRSTAGGGTGSSSGSSVGKVSLAQGRQSSQFGTGSSLPERLNAVGNLDGLGADAILHFGMHGG